MESLYPLLNCQLCRENKDWFCPPPSLFPPLRTNSNYNDWKHENRILISKCWNNLSIIALLHTFANSGRIFANYMIRIHMWKCLPLNPIANCTKYWCRLRNLVKNRKYPRNYVFEYRVGLGTTIVIGNITVKLCACSVAGKIIAAAAASTHYARLKWSV